MLYSLTVILWATALLSIVYFYQKWTSYKAFRAAALQHGCKRPPKYPHTEPFFGTDLLRERNKLKKEGRLMRSLGAHYELLGKTYQERFFDLTIINTKEARNIQQVTALGFNDYSKASLAGANPMFGNGILNQEGAVWKHSRGLVKPTFARSEIADVAMFEFHFERFLGGIPRDGTTIDLQLPIHKLFLDAASEFILGQSMDSQLPDDPNDSAGYLKAFNDGLGEIAKRATIGKLSPMIFFFDKKYKRAYEKLHSYVDVDVKRALEATSPKNLQKMGDEEKQTRYILLHEMAKQVRDPIELRFQILHVFIAARATTSILMANIIFNLARHPHIWAKLREQSLELGNQPLTFELLKSLTFFRHVIHETLRLTGPSGRTRRQAIRNTILPVGGGHDGKAPVFVEKGTMVALDLYSLHHDKDIWGEDAFEFNPHRWEGKKPMWEFTPFLGGPRMCPAQQQVLTQSVYFLVRMTKEFVKIENRDEVLEYVETARGTVESRNGVKVAFFSS
ncbi:cytochrome P450 [Stipitochalara longipes BDJ]|nr:cytochrome P450 [Stipitochalara longipes BDJ]